MTLPWDALVAACGTSDEVMLAAPYMKVEPLRRMLVAMPAEAALICVTRWTPQDILVGASDPDCRSLVVARGGEFLLCPTLHAKYYRCGSEVLVGSANLTQSGMGYGAFPNLEILCQPGSSFDAKQFEQTLMQTSRPVSDIDFQRWSAIPRVASLPASDDDVQRVSGWRPVTRDPEHVWLAYQGQVDRIPSIDEQRLARVDIEQTQLPNELGREEFDSWMRACLLASTIVSDVRQRERLSDPVVWEQLAAAWSMSKSEVDRICGTVTNWVQAFLVP